VEIRHYVTASGRDPYQEWLNDLGDLKGRVIIQRRIDRILKGNLGDHKFVKMEYGN
jgi:putative component of toxin-antitoxin plasmid stabilization module